MNKMIWKKIDPENLPKGEVVAANFKEANYWYLKKLLGKIYVDTYGAYCKSDTEVSVYVTHYHELPNDEEREG